MKPLISRFWMMAILLFSCMAAWGQYSDWVNYTNGNEIIDMATVGDTLYLATTGGLVAYDKLSGNAKVFTKTNSPLPSHNISTIVAGYTTNGLKVLVGTFDKGLAIRREIGGWAKFDTSNSVLTSNQIHDVSIDGKEGFWIGTSTDLINMDSFDDLTIEQAGVQNITSVAIDTNNIIWIGTQNGQILSKDGLWFSEFQIASTITALTVDTSNTPWAGTSMHGVLKWSPVGGWAIYDSTNSDLQDNWISDIHAGTDGSIWVGTTNWGLARLYNIDLWDIYTTASTAIPSDHIRSVLPEPDGSVWVGSKEVGLMKLTGTTWTNNYTISDMPLLSHHLYYVSAEEASGKIWIYIQDENFVSHFQSFDGNNWTTTTNITGVQFPAVTGMVNTSDNRLAVSMQGDGIYTFDGGEWFKDTSVPNDFINDLYKDPKGRLYVATQSGVAYQNGSSWTSLTNQNSGLPNDYTSTISAYDTNDIWVAAEIQTEDYVIYHYNGASWTTYDSLNSPIRAFSALHDMASDDSANVWVATAKGLLRYENENWTSITTKNSNLITDHIQSLYTHESGNVWIGTAYGLIRGNSSDTLLFTTENSGLPSNQIFDITVDSNGYPWICTNQGLVRYDGGLAGIATLSYDPPDTLDFGTLVQHTNLSQVMGITNNGPGDAVIQSATLIGKDASLFTLQTDVTGNLAESSSANLQILFEALTSGTKSASLVITSNTQTSPDTIALSAYVIRPLVQLSQTAVQFGTIQVGNTQDWSGTVTNSGNAPLVINNVLLSQQGSVYTVLSAPQAGDTLDPGISSALSVRFNPTADTLYGAALIIVSNAPSSPDSIYISGEGAQIPQVFLGASTIDFGRIQRNTTTDRAAKLSNTGNDSLMVYGIYLAQQSTVFSLSNATPQNLAPGDSQTFTVTFQPGTIGNFQDFVVIESNAPTTPDTIQLYGQGVIFSFSIPTAPDTAIFGENVNFEFNITNLALNDIVYFYYRLAGWLTWERLACTRNGLFYSITIPDSLLSNKGLSYYIAVEDQSGSLLILHGDPNAAEWLDVYLQTVNFNYPTQFAARTFHMISVPYQLSSAGILSALGDDLGEYNHDWRFFQWHLNQYLSLGDGTFTSFEPGRGYWIVLSNVLNIDLPESRAVRGDYPFDVPLAPGWNQIGDPFLFPVSWSDVENTTEIQSPAQWIAEHDTIGWYNYSDTTLNPWVGYFVYNMSPNSVTITIPPVAANNGTPKTNVLANVLTEDEFNLQLMIDTHGSAMGDRENYLGFLDQATDDIDNHDNFEAPAMNSHINLSIMQDGYACAVNYKIPKKDGESWDLNITGLQQNKNAVLRFLEHAPIPEGFSVWLLDQDRRCLLPFDNNQTTIPALNQSDVRQLRLIVGTEVYAKENNDDISLIPYTFNLSQNYPNPFNPETHIQYEVPYLSNVKLTLFNIVGQKIQTFVNETKESGQYKIKWDGRDRFGRLSPSGIYIYKLEFDGNQRIRKLILIR